MAERFGTIEHIDRLYNQNSRDYEFDRLEATHGGEDYSPEWVTNRSIIKVCQVPWDSSYNNVIDWSHNDRTAYFESLNGRVFDFDTSWNFKKLEEFKASVNGYVGECDVPLTFEEALYYNYVWIRQYRQHVAKGEVIEDFFFFIHSLDKIAPNTTRLNIHNDIWTQYMTHFTFSYGDLERGHYPHYIEDVEHFFHSPINSRMDLTEPEPDLPSVKSATRYEDFIQLDSELVAVVVSDVLLEQGFYRDAGNRWWEDFDSLPASAPEAGAYPRRHETFTPDSNGSSIGRRGGGSSFTADYLSMVDAPQSFYNQTWDNSPTQQLCFYSMALVDVIKLIEKLHASYPHIVDKIRAIYVMPKNFVSTGSPVTIIGGVQADKIQPRSELEEVSKITLAPKDFGLESAFAKLYTGQFAEIEFSTLSGERVSVAFENFSEHVRIMGRSHNSFPFLKLEAFICGIGGHENDHNYTFKAFDSGILHSWGDSWENFRFNVPFPIYSLYASGDTLNALDYVSNVNAREKIARDNAIALQDARNTLENAYNTAYKEGSQGVFNSNIAKETGDRSNAASKQISDNDANTTKTVSDRSATTQHTNDSDVNKTTQETTMKDIETADAIAEKNFTFNYNQTQRAIDKNNYFETVLNRYYQVAPLSQQLDFIDQRAGWKHGLLNASIAAGGGATFGWEAVATLIKNAVTNNTQDSRNSSQGREKPQQASSSSSAGSNTGGGNMGFGGPTAPQTFVYAGQLVAQIAIGNTQLNRAIAWESEELRWKREFQREMIDKYAAETKSFNEDQNNELLNNSRECNETDIVNKKYHENRRYATQQQVIDLTRDTALANNANEHSNSLNNNAISYNATAANIQTSRDAGVTNAHHGEAVSIANADNTYKTAVDRARSSSIALERQQEAGLKAHTFDRLVEVSSFSGDNANAVDNGHCGVSVKIRTVPQAQQRQVEQCFNRWGYRMKAGTVISTPKRLSLFSHFTYWKFRDIEGYIDGNISSINAIKEILREGVTVWTDPSTIYDFSHNERIDNAI